MTLFGITVSMTIVWFVIAIALLITEALTVGLTTIWFAIGAFAALICALFDFSTILQVIVFLAVSLFLLIFTRKIFVEKLKAGSQKTNVDALIGEKGLTISSIKPYAVGQVKIEGQVWSAVSEEQDAEIEANTLVKVLAVEGVKLIVSPEK